MAENAPTFDKTHWEELVTKPTWYFDYVEFSNKAKEVLGEDSQELKDLTDQLRDFFEEALMLGKVALAKEGPNLDQDRKPIDTIVIHHTSDKPGYRLPHMNAVQLLNVYAPYFANPTGPKEKFLKGQPIWSNHVRNDQPVFYLYHWLMRMDGGFERLLEDDELGWHAANWDVNTKSVAICLDNDYEKQDPAEEVLEKLAEFIAKNYPNVQKDNIIGHNEAAKAASRETICPGANFEKVWKKKLIRLIY
jgi:hypothetical protein